MELAKSNNVRQNVDLIESFQDDDSVQTDAGSEGKVEAWIGEPLIAVINVCSQTSEDLLANFEIPKQKTM